MQGCKLSQLALQNSVSTSESSFALVAYKRFLAPIKENRTYWWKVVSPTKYNNDFIFFQSAFLLFDIKFSGYKKTKFYTDRAGMCF